ncbi:MAG: UDP-N-acetylglucosamine 2-epimerase [Candidatus Bathycorpusculaceae bacterium]
MLSFLGYLDFLVLMERCDLTVTDFGGIQEEATAPCIRKLVSVIRHLTERDQKQLMRDSEKLLAQKRERY